MDNKDREILMRILKHADHAIKYASGHQTMESFEADDMCVEATVFNLMQIGELAKTSLCDELKKQINGIPWNQIYALSKRIVHGYAAVNLSIVWDTIKDDLPVLEREIREALK